MDRILERNLKPWLVKASRLVESRISDARAHAEKAITDAAKETADGRPTARRIERSPSYQAALARLDGLQAALIGPSTDSLQGLIRDARAQFYKDSIPLWLPHIDLEFRVSPNPQPTIEGERFARGALIHDYDLHREVAPRFVSVANALFASLNQATRGIAGAKHGSFVLNLWQRRAVGSITRVVEDSLSDGQEAVHQAVSILLIHERYRDQIDFPTGMNF